MENFQKIAVLIDADNTQLSKLEAVLHEVSTYGRIVVKKAYGNWRKDSLKNWEPELKRLAIRAEQQFDYVAGKNTTDIAMVIGAMDLLHNNMYDALVLVSSDSDFTPLAIRLRESGLYIIGAGVTGCAVARHLSRFRLKIALIDAAEDVAMGASRANSAIVHAGYSPVIGVLGSLIATFAVCFPSFVLMLLISKYFLKFQKHPTVESVFKGLRPAVVGLLAASALLLMNTANFGSPDESMLQVVVSILLFAGTFIASYIYKVNPILLIILCGAVGGIVYSI